MRAENRMTGVEWRLTFLLVVWFVDCGKTAAPRQRGSANFQLPTHPTPVSPPQPCPPHLTEQPAPSPFSLLAIRPGMFFQSRNSKFGEPNHPADAMKKAKEKREVLIRVASESLSAQLAGANSDATRFSVHREGNFSGRFECRGSGFDVRWSPNNSLKRTGVTIHMLSTSTRPSLSCIR